MKRNLSVRKSRKSFDYSEEDFCKCGWLKKQGGTFKTMKRRYFILVDDILYYFTNHTRNCLKGQINLRNLELSELEEDKSSGEYFFNILPETGKECINETHVKYQLCCSVKTEAEEWVQQIKQKMFLRKGGGLFGTPLSTVMIHLKSQYNYVPRVVFECCQRIREIGMTEEGIFRKNGQQSLVFQMKSNVDRAKYNLEDVDVHTLCSLLKLYLRELPEPLIPFSHYDSLKAVGYRIDVKEDLNLVRDKLIMLPLPNLQLLKYLCEFLLEVSSHPENRMEIMSLAKIFSPNILRDQDMDPYIEESTSSIISVTVAAFIKSQKDLFLFEYEPLEIYEEESVKDDEDTYSLTSALSNINFQYAFMAVGNIDGSSSSLSTEHNNSDLTSSSSFPHLNITEKVNDSPLISRINSMKSVTLDGVSVEKTPVSVKRCSLSKGNFDHFLNNETMNICKKCESLEKDLLLVTEQRDQLQKLFDNKIKTCLQLQDEIDFLRLKLTESIKLRAENPNDLSDVLEYFNMNK